MALFSRGRGEKATRQGLAQPRRTDVSAKRTQARRKEWGKTRCTRLQAKLLAHVNRTTNKAKTQGAQEARRSSRGEKGKNEGGRHRGAERTIARGNANAGIAWAHARQQGEGNATSGDGWVDGQKSKKTGWVEVVTSRQSDRCAHEWLQKFDFS